VRLYFAVLDGSDPTTWSPYGKSFPDFMGDACKAAQPSSRLVSADLLEDYNVRIEPIWSGPDDLLKEQALDRVVGVIIDAFPKPNLHDDRAEKARIMRRHVRRLQESNLANESAFFKHFRYAIWFMTDDTTEIAEFKDSVINAAAKVLGIDRIEDQVFTEESLLGVHLKYYVRHIYSILGQGLIP
jgi:hypothetical protein